MPLEGTPSSSDLDEKEVLPNLGRVLESPMFRQSERMRRFLRFVVNHSLNNGGEPLKESVIGIHVFDREPGYDPKGDPIVRVEARRLRKKLDEYYENSGNTDPVIIRIPKGQYKAEFSRVEVPAEESSPIGPVLEISSVEMVPMEILAPEPAARPLPLSDPERKVPAETRNWRPVAWFALAVSATSIAIALARRQPNPSGPAVASIRPPITNYAGSEFDPAISPDGKQVAFVWDGNRNNFDVYVKQVSGGEPIRVTSDPAHDLHPAWSPDGRYLAFLRASAKEQSIVIMPASGGPERAVAGVRSEMAAFRADATQMAGNPGPAWSRDGKFLAVTICPPLGGEACGIDLVSLDGSETRQITFPHGIGNDFYPAFSPNGRYLSFVRRTSNSISDVFVADLKTNSSRRLTFDNRDIRGAAWSADSKWLCISSNRSGTYGLWAVDLSGKMQMIPTTTQRATGPVVSTEGWIAYTDVVQNTNIWRRRLKGGNQASLLISSSGRNDSPHYSPDGHRIAFVSDRSGSWEIWVAGADGSEPRQLTDFRAGMVGAPRWSPDGKTIAFDARPEGHAAIFLVPSNGGAVRRFTNDSFENRMPSWSRDGKWIYFNSSRDGAVRLWKVRVDQSEAVRLTTQLCYDSAESPDGKFVYFVTSGKGFWKVTTDGRSESAIPSLAAVDPRRYWTVGAEGLYYVASQSRPSEVWLYRPSSEKPGRASQIDGQLVIDTPSLSVSPDVEYMLYAQQDISGSDIQRVAVSPGSFDFRKQ